MNKGSILSRIVKEISLANYASDTPLTSKVEWYIDQAIPLDVRGWFFAEVGNQPLSQEQGLRLIKWLFLDHKKGKINTKNIKLIRQARREQYLEIIKENLPTPAVMANVTAIQLSVYILPDDIKSKLLPYLAQTLKRDQNSVTIAIQWATRSNKLSGLDHEWMLRYTQPISEFEQILLFETPPAERVEPGQGEILDRQSNEPEA